jgi:hypothetical protein
MMGRTARIEAMASKPKPKEPDKFNTPKPHDLPEDAVTDPADTSGPHGPGSEPLPEDEEKP